MVSATPITDYIGRPTSYAQLYGGGYGYGAPYRFGYPGGSTYCTVQSGYGEDRLVCYNPRPSFGYWGSGYFPRYGYVSNRWNRFSPQGYSIGSSGQITPYIVG